MHLRVLALIGLVLSSLCARVCSHRPRTVDRATESKLSGSEDELERTPSPTAKEHQSPPRDPGDGTGGTRVLVENLAPDATKEYVRAKAEQFGRVLSIQMLPKSRPKDVPQSAYIEFERAEDANKVVKQAKEKTIKFGEGVTVKIAPRGDRGVVAYQRRILVEGLDANMTEEMIKLAAQKVSSPDRVILVRILPGGKPGVKSERRSAYVYFESAASVEKVLTFTKKTGMFGAQTIVKAAPDGPIIEEDVERVLKEIGYDYMNKPAAGGDNGEIGDEVDDNKTRSKSGALSYCHRFARFGTVLGALLAVSTDI